MGHMCSTKPEDLSSDSQYPHIKLDKLAHACNPSVFLKARWEVATEFPEALAGLPFLAAESKRPRYTQG